MGKSFYLKLLIVLAVLGAAGAYYYPKVRGSNSSPGVAREFRLQDRGGAIHLLEALKGQVVLIHFWASWCPPCLPELPQWLALAAELEDEPVRFVAISIDESWSEAMKVMPETLPGNVISLLDPGGKVAEQYGTFQYPETYILDKRHNVLLKLVGPQEWQGPKIMGLIDRAINE